MRQVSGQTCPRNPRARLTLERASLPWVRAAINAYMRAAPHPEGSGWKRWSPGTHPDQLPPPRHERGHFARVADQVAGVRIGDRLVKTSAAIRPDQAFLASGWRQTMTPIRAAARTRRVAPMATAIETEKMVPRTASSRPLPVRIPEPNIE